MIRSEERDFEAEAERPGAVRFGRWACGQFARYYHHLSLLNACTLPQRGPAILVCNHISGIDPVMIQAACPRLIVWMMAREYYEIGALRWFFQRLQAIPVERTGRDLASTRMAFRALANGRVLGVFPEGRIAPSRQLLPFQTGVALLALRSGAPVYPAYLEGTSRMTEMVEAFFSPQRLTIRFGPEVLLDRSDASKQGIEAATVKIQQAVAALAPAAGDDSG